MNHYLWLWIDSFLYFFIKISCCRRFLESWLFPNSYDLICLGSWTLGPDMSHITYDIMQFHTCRMERKSKNLSRFITWRINLAINTFYKFCSILYFAYIICHMAVAFIRIILFFKNWCDNIICCHNSYRNYLVMTLFLNTKLKHNFRITK